MLARYDGPTFWSEDPGRKLHVLMHDGLFKGESRGREGRLQLRQKFIDLGTTPFLVSAIFCLAHPSGCVQMDVSCTSIVNYRRLTSIFDLFDPVARFRPGIA